MQLPKMTVRQLMVVVGLAGITFGIYSHNERHNHDLLITLSEFAVDKARNELGDLAGFDITARWLGGHVQVDLKPKNRGQEGRRYLVGYIGEILSAQRIPSSYSLNQERDPALYPPLPKSR